MKIINNLINKKVKIMNEGTVKFFNDARGFGFIKTADSDQDVFVHQSGLIDEIREDDNVKFDIEKSQKGLSAINVELI